MANQTFVELTFWKQFYFAAPKIVPSTDHIPMAIFYDTLYNVMLSAVTVWRVSSIIATPTVKLLGGGRDVEFFRPSDSDPCFFYRYITSPPEDPPISSLKTFAWR